MMASCYHDVKRLLSGDIMSTMEIISDYNAPKPRLEEIFDKATCINGMDWDGGHSCGIERDQCIIEETGEPQFQRYEITDTDDSTYAYTGEEMAAFARTW